LKFQGVNYFYGSKIMELFWEKMYYLVQINKLLHLSFLFSGQLRSSRGRVVYCQIPSNFVLQLYSFDSGYSLVVFGKDILSGGGENKKRQMQ
jgi:hypothetical protein